MFSFKPNEIINDPKLLFGRNKPRQLLDQALTNIQRGTPFQLYGERRSGKTSILACLEKILRYDAKFVPIIIDFKKHSSIRGNANVIRYIIARCAYNIGKYVEITNTISVGGLEIKSAVNWEDFFESLQDIADFRLPRLLEEIMKITRDKYNRKFVLLIDEYEFLFLHSFESPNGFFVLRELSALPDAPLVYVIAGATKWDALCSETGSPELNNLGGSLLYVSPIDFDDFEEMWDYYTSEFQSECMLYECQKIYELSGGIPFLAKMIGECQLSGLNKMIDVNLSPHFLQMFNNLNNSEQEIIAKVMNRDKLDYFNANDLLYRGILKLEGENYDINGLLFKNYIYSRTYKPSKDDERQLKLWDYKRKIQNLITVINDTSHNKQGKNIFEVSNTDLKNYADMAKLAVDREDINTFASAVYLTVFDRTADRVPTTDSNNVTREISKNLARLPKKFTRKHKFVKIIDSLRHHYGGHNTQLPTFNITRTQLEKSEVLMILTNSLNEPLLPNEIYMLHEKFLTLFIEYLEELNNAMREDEPKATILA